LMNPARFWTPWGIRSLAADEVMYRPDDSRGNPSNWLGPIWIVAEYLCFRALLDYGYVEEAKELCEKTLTLLGEDLEATGCLHEYYNPFTGEGIMNGGFLNWNILVLNMTEELRERGISL
ncbi:MAG: trehalase / alfa-L-rhamnosidase / mannosyl oligosaccharide glucosidase, partial [Lachnospiraceae bacterium]|nr:trehalase / alfa-L-rhamnosidase / mannosyl oligosaccharide glucosidase [Lachnospiraceae bacterium]